MRRGQRPQQRLHHRPKVQPRTARPRQLVARAVDLALEQQADVVDAVARAIPAASTLPTSTSRVVAALDHRHRGLSVLVDAQCIGDVVPRPAGTIPSAGRPSAGSAISPFTTSCTVPSPPIAMTASHPRSPASRTISRPRRAGSSARAAARTGRPAPSAATRPVAPYGRGQTADSDGDEAAQGAWRKGMSK